MANNKMAGIFHKKIESSISYSCHFKVLDIFNIAYIVAELMSLLT